LIIIETVQLREVDMGLDMYAYTAAQANTDWNSGEQREIAYWRKHPNLHGWMEQLWNQKSRPGMDKSYQDVMFNGVEVELTWEDLDNLEEDVTNDRLPSTSGFFFGSNSDDYYREQDLEFIRKARAEIFTGLKVFYNSSW
jgi:hypothetical protein